MACVRCDVMAEAGGEIDMRLFCTGYEPASGPKKVARRNGTIGARIAHTTKVVHEQGKLVYDQARMAIGPEALVQMIIARKVK